MWAASKKIHALTLQIPGEDPVEWLVAMVLHPPWYLLSDYVVLANPVTLFLIT